MSNRFTDDDIAKIIAEVRATRAGERHPVAGFDVVAMAREIQERRAADLTPDEVAQVRDLLLSLDGEPMAMRAALSKILRAHGIDPGSTP